MSEPRPIASLTANLLARKGAARPAMRSPLQGPELDDVANAWHPGDDLGWNDFGPGHDPAAGAQVVPLAETMPEPPAGLPEVVRQQNAIAGRLAGTVLREAGRDASSDSRDSRDSRTKPRRSALAEGRRAAFTLRLDAERHLALRLAATLTGRSAQQLVTEALDRLIEQCPDVAAIAAKIKTRR